MTCTQCGARLTPDEEAWGTQLCDQCALAPTDRAAARVALQRALATYYASPEYARWVAASREDAA